jgi:hypothetical protein
LTLAVLSHLTILVWSNPLGKARKGTRGYGFTGGGEGGRGAEVAGVWSVELGDKSPISTSSLDPVTSLTSTWLIVRAVAGPELGKAKGGEASFSAAFFFSILDLGWCFFSIFQKDP